MLTTPGEFHLKRSVNVIFLVANVLGACVYVLRASTGWAIPEEHCEIPLTGEPYSWFGAIAPVILLFTLLNLTWAALIFRSREWRSSGFWLSAACAWVVGMVIDFAHHCR